MMRNKKLLTKLFQRINIASIILLISMFATTAHAQTGKVGVSRPLVLMISLMALALAPFVKIAVVLSLIRNAIGTQQVPPNLIITGMAIILTIYIMMPVGYKMYKQASDVINQGTNQPLLSQASVELMIKAAKQSKEPIRDFLVQHTNSKERLLFFSLAKKIAKDEEYRNSITDKDFVNIVPAFVVTELAEAFQIGFLLFLPFLIIDLVIANVLLSLGMFQISPVTISLPFKLLLFVLIDGWHIITRGLILGYV